MGCGTTQAVAMKLGRRFIGADINAGAIQTTIKRLINTADELKSKSDKKYYTGFSVYNVNQYDIFRNELEAKDLIIEALGIERLNSGSIFDGTKDEFKVKIMPINRIATRKDVSDLVNNLDYKNFEKSKLENPMKLVDNIMLVCMGHEPELAAHFEKETMKYKIKLKVYDILKDGSHLTFKRDSEATIEIKNNILEIKQFYPTMLLEKLRKQNESVTEYRELVESVMIDPHYDGAVFTPTIKDIPGKHEFIKGRYELPADHGRVAIKITDLLSETFFTEVSQLEKEDLYV
jgi:site-specific DNA-methyltransferase (adenine-specific)/adenine-specific DNA-methyltransferase